MLAQAGPQRSGHACVVADDVHGSEGVQCLLRELLEVLRFRDVGPDAQHVDAFLAELRLGETQSVLLDVGEHDLHAFVGEPLREPPADAARCACYDGYSITKLFHLGSLMISLGYRLGGPDIAF